MKVHVVRTPADPFSVELLERNYRLRYAIFAETQGWEAIRRPDRRDVDAFDNADATHLLLTDGDELVGGSRLTPLHKPNLLQTVFSGLVLGKLPASPSLGADWTRFYVRPDRREGRRRAPSLRPFLCAMMEYAVLEGYSYITFVSTVYMVEHGVSVGWRITPLGRPALIDGKPTIAAWIEVSEQALDNVRRVTGQAKSLLLERPPLRRTIPPRLAIQTRPAFAMSDALDLIKAILAEDGPDDAVARLVLETALEREVDVLLYCAATLGLGATLVMARAAAWAGYGFYPHVPPSLTGRAEPTRLEALAEVRLFRVQLLDREIAFAAPDFHGVIRLKQRREAAPRLRALLCLVPEPELRALARVAAPALLDGARQNLARRWPYASAQLELIAPIRYGFMAALTLLLLLLLLAPFVAQPWLLPLVFALLVAPAAAARRHFRAPPPTPAAIRPPDEELPVYSVLIPLRCEVAMVPQLFAAMGALDYPAERLDIKFVVEARSLATIDAIRRRLGAPQFGLVPVPDAAPRTKPKALDFALPLCRGEHVVVYDAEDIPDPDQLWKAALRFRAAPELVCLQARLVIGNGRRNWLAALFAGEYAGLFTVLLPALAQWRLPLPLGGTSNHFRLSALRELGGWDAFNVTEDADLGMRLARRRLGVAMLDSVTREEAPTQLRDWLGQRTRWMKGWMQTLIVHNHRPLRLLRELGLVGFLTFQLLVLGMITAPILHCGFAVVVLFKGLTGMGGVGGFYLGVLALGYGGALATTVLGLARLRKLDLVASQLLLPLYWLLMGVATVRAAYELLVRPFYWFKSPHHPEPVPPRPLPVQPQAVAQTIT